MNITPASGSAIVLDGAINVDAGVVTGATSITTQTQVASTSVQTPLIEYTDGDDALTIANGGGVTFSQAATLPTGSTIGNLTLANGSITDSGGAIDFDNENLTTAGIVSAEQLTTTDDLTVTDVATIDGTMTISSGSITDSGGSISFGNENISTTGTLSSGAATLATGSTVGNLTLANGSITDSGGAIDFGNENLSTSGNMTVTSSVQTTTIDYTDGTLALTVASDGTITSSGNVVATGDLTVSGNDIKDNGGSAAVSYTHLTLPTKA